MISFWVLAVIGGGCTTVLALWLEDLMSHRFGANLDFPPPTEDPSYDNGSPAPIRAKEKHTSND